MPGDGIRRHHPQSQEETWAALCVGWEPTDDWDQRRDENGLSVKRTPLGLLCGEECVVGAKLRDRNMEDRKLLWSECVPPKFSLKS